MMRGFGDDDLGQTLVDKEWKEGDLGRNSIELLKICLKICLIF